MNRHIEQIANATLTLAVLVVAAVVVRREFFPPQRALPSEPKSEPVYLKTWKNLEAKGITIGPSGAPLRLIVFSDLECPYCKAFHSTLLDLQRELGSEFAYTFVHLPLSNHRFAAPAARAAECAAAQSRFEKFITVVYAKQDSLGLKTWGSYASEASIPDTTRFSVCISDRDPVSRIEDGRAAATSAGFRSTPTVIVNGWHVPIPPTLDELRRIALAVKSGTAPFPKGPPRSGEPERSG